jgi:hypothetical protein
MNKQCFLHSYRLKQRRIGTMALTLVSVSFLFAGLSTTKCLAEFGVDRGLGWCPTCRTDHPDDHPHFNPIWNEPDQPSWNQTGQSTWNASQQTSRPTVSEQERQLRKLLRDVDAYGKLYNEANTHENRLWYLNKAKAILEEASTMAWGDRRVTERVGMVDLGIRSTRDKLQRDRFAKTLLDTKRMRVDTLGQLHDLAAGLTEQLRHTLNSEVRRKDKPQGGLVQIGAVAAVAGEVWAKSPGSQRRRSLSSGKTIFSNDVIKTGPNGRVQILFADETVLTLGPNTEVVLDNYAYNPFDSSGEISTRINHGTLSIVSGKMRSISERRLKTPGGYIGIRGTELLVTIHDDKSGSVAVLHGEIDYSPDNRAFSRVTVSAGQFIDFTSDGEPGEVMSEQEVASVQDRAVAFSEGDPRAPGLILIEGVLFPGDLGWWLVLKYSLVVLGFVALFGWANPEEIDTSVPMPGAMLAHAIVGFLFLAGSFCLSYFVA